MCKFINSQDKSIQKIHRVDLRDAYRGIYLQGTSQIHVLGHRAVLNGFETQF